MVAEFPVCSAFKEKLHHNQYDPSTNVLIQFESKTVRLNSNEEITSDEEVTGLSRILENLTESVLSIKKGL